MKIPTSQVVEVVRADPGITNMKIAEVMGVLSNPLSSVLLKLCRRNVLRRVAGMGPRGGYGYFVVDGV